MAKIPVNPESSVFKINNAGVEQHQRPYLGMSSIGDPCVRKLQYNFHWASESIISARIQRIFSLGHLMEQMAIQALMDIGCKISNQQHELVGFDPHVLGHIDGDVLNLPEAPKTTHLLEIKTHNEKSFTDFKKKGLKLSKPVHYDQMQKYMDAGGYARGLYLAINKNTCEIWLERVYPDPDAQEILRAKEVNVVVNEQLAPRIGNNSKSWYECKMCQNADICFGEVPVNQHCRTCTHVTKQLKGVWYCQHPNHEMRLDVDKQRVGCADFEYHPMFT